MNATPPAATSRHAWLQWLHWDDEAHCRWAVDYLAECGLASPPTADSSARQQLDSLISSWPAWETCFGTEAYSQLDEQMRAAYRAPTGPA